MMDPATWVELLRQGGVVACPTETWLGLLADAANQDAVAKVAELKGRPAHMPIALLIPSADAISEVADSVPDAARELMKAHWPGPLTVLVPAKSSLSPLLVRDGKVGVRVPGPSPAADLTRAFGGALTATSANLSGEPPLRSADQLSGALAHGLAGRVPGTSPGGPPSTLVDTTTSPMTIVRAGAIDLNGAAL